MNLSGVLAAITQLPSFGRVLADLQSEQPSRPFVLGSATAPVLAAIANETHRPMLILTSRGERARGLADQISVWLDDPGRVRMMPEPDGLPYERFLPDPLTSQGRLSALRALVDPAGAPIVVASAHACLPRTIPPDQLRDRSRTITVGDRVQLEALTAALVDLGYEGVPAVTMPGTFARRGGILDVFSPVQAEPVRIELFGDEVDSLRQFDPATQRSSSIVEQAVISPARERLAASVPSLNLSGLTEESRLRLRADLERISNGDTFEGIDFYSGLLPGGTLLDFLPADGVLVVENPRDLRLAAVGLNDQAVSLRDDMVARRELPPDFPSPLISADDLMAAIDRIPRRLLLDPWQPDEEGAEGAEAPGQPRLPFLPVDAYAGKLRQFIHMIDEERKAGRPLLITSNQHARLRELLEEAGIGVRRDDTPNAPPGAGEIIITNGSLAEGWQLTSGLVIYSDREIFGLAKPRRPVRTKPKTERISPAVFLTDLRPGDYVVHVEHGIGRFAGTVTREVGDAPPREYLIVEYAEEDRLFVPVDQIDRVSRYIGGTDRVPSLTKLHSGEWTKSKTRVRRAVQVIARDLVRLYAVRTLRPGHAFGPDSVWQREMEEAFPYIETVDQMQAIEEVKIDMQQERPMDRLVCGDVGYGKTEVAVRAAFKVVQEGYQVAVLVPTTVLAQQHLQTFTERLGAYPVRVEGLSRLRSEKDQQAVVDGLKQGSIDIVIGTHRLVQKDVTFKNLGLVIVDEEQRFGVAQKEILKKMRTEVDVLTLTATPIPRTMHQALVGVRDLSRIDTPPEARLPIKTTVAEFDDALVRQAILRELDRGGQVFYVHNRVYNIDLVAAHLQELLPDARILIGHGQMPDEQLERVMLDFAAGKADILVCTTIIESGLDLPNVNTMIVDDAQRYGLAQLYQLRGRIGRSAARAYAYLLFPRNIRLTEIAERRLRTILEASELGAGYQIAMRDLEIRGAGNLLGVEQSGNIDAVGFDLYTKLLAEAVAELKASLDGEPVAMRAPAAPEGPAIDLRVPAHLPLDYVQDLSTRLILYQRLVTARGVDEVEALAQEIRDRFGPLPEPVRNLLVITQLRVSAAGRGIENISTRDEDVIIQMSQDRPLDRIRLQRALGPAVRVGNTQLRINRQSAGPRWIETLRGAVQLLAAG